MRSYVIIALAFSLASSTWVLGTGLSETNQGVYLAIGGDRSTNDPIRFDERLAYYPFCNTGDVLLAEAPFEYGARIRMVGPDGQEVPKTPLGQTFGSRFDQLHNYRDARLGSICACGPYTGLLGSVLPSAKELFVMKAPGIYTLEIQMQMFRSGSPPDTNAATRNPIQFSPVRIKIQKPAGLNAK
jgi:hypothetical protein